MFVFLCILQILHVDWIVYMAEHVLHHGQAKDISANAIPQENTSTRYANTNVSKVKMRQDAIMNKLFF